jgi:hypothetical protein
MNTTELSEAIQRLRDSIHGDCCIGQDSEKLLIDEIKAKFAELLAKRNAEPFAWHVKSERMNYVEMDYEVAKAYSAKGAAITPLYRASLPAEQDVEPFAWYREMPMEYAGNCIEHINEKGEAVYIDFRMSTPPDNRGWIPLAIAKRKDGV